ncbi:MAG: TonB family protein [Gemmatimonadetes bacterium]|nr:TonB family protein [Gemmatimonadota bacterium]
MNTGSHVAVRVLPAARARHWRKRRCSVTASMSAYILLGAVAWCPRAGAQVKATLPVPGFQIQGSVTDSAGVPLSGAETRLAGGGTSARTSRDGRYVLRDVPAGSHRLLARRVGFAPEVVDVSGEPGGKLVVDFALRRAPQVLSAVEVVDRPLVPAKYRFTTRFDPFFIHRATAPAGLFFDHDDLERRGGVARALTAVSGISAREFMGGLSVKFKRCGNGTQPAVLVNGVLTNGGALPTIPVGSIELIEVYRGIADMPIEARGNSCGAISIYTK